jgi:curved DNA-binding protein CbpA
MASDSGSKTGNSDLGDCSFALEQQTFYDTLGVSKAASSSEIKASWRALLLATHPDKNDNANTDQLRRILEAYSTLSDPTLRREYDEMLENVLHPKPSYDRVPMRMNPPVVSMKGRLVRINWSLESKDEEQQVENFVLELKQDGYATQQAYEGNSHHVSISGLTVGWLYHFRVCAVNPKGAGEFSQWSTFKATPSSSITELEAHTQEYINNIHVAVSTRNLDVLEQLLTQAARFDVKSQFSDILALAWSTLANTPLYSQPHNHLQVSFVERVHSHYFPTKNPFSMQNCPKSLL